MNYDSDGRKFNTRSIASLIFFQAAVSVCNCFFPGGPEEIFFPPPIRFRDPPACNNPAAALQPMQRWIERAFFHLQKLPAYIA